MKVSRSGSVRKGKWKNDMFFAEIMQVQEPVCHRRRDSHKLRCSVSLEDETCTEVEAARL